MSPESPEIILKEGQLLSGFLIRKITTLPDMHCVAYEAEHEKSGAQLIHLHTDDRENMFAIGFRTPPPDNTGLPHILEHTVFCGSNKYPVKDPFIELLKTSLATFLNAMTYPDRTIYPCASMNEKDFYNLVSVYCDSVFSPILSEMHFKQEGHHLDFSSQGDINSSLIIKGVVYNEMKGAYSDLDGTIEKEQCRHLLPDNAYGHDYGGDPDFIPELTYNRFKNYHRIYYHPSNSLIFLFGNLETEKHCRYLDRNFLSDFDRSSINTGISVQKRWDAVQYATVHYPVGSSEDTKNKTAILLTCLANESTDIIRTLARRILSDYLIGNAGSPLRKALIDSNLGEELTSSGYTYDIRDTYFTVGLKGTDACNLQEIIEIVNSTCRNIIAQGMNKKKLDATFHKFEILAREIKSAYPLRLMDRVFSSWSAGSNPLLWVNLNPYLEKIRNLYEKQSGFFEDQLKELIPENRHCSIITFVPDPELNAKTEQLFRKKMEKTKNTLTSDQLNRITNEAAELNHMQASPNTPEALETLPRLLLSDVPRDPSTLNTTVSESAGRPMLYTDMFSNGLTYVTLSLDLSGLPGDLLPYLPVFTACMRKTGAGSRDFAEMAEREAEYSGGLSAGLSSDGRYDNPLLVKPVLFVSAKSLDRNLEKMLSILEDRLLSCDLNDTKRIENIILQERVQARSCVINSGSINAVEYASRHLNENCRINEILNGITQVRFVDKLADEFPNNKQNTISKFSEIHRFLLDRQRITLSILGKPHARKIVEKWFFDLDIEAGSEGEKREDHFLSKTHKKSQCLDGIAVASDVSFVAVSFPTAGYSDPASPALALLKSSLWLGYLWDEIRVKKGAYGCFVYHDFLKGIYSISSFRDPFIRETIETYKGIFSYINDKMDLSDHAVSQAIIGTIKNLDEPVRPGQAVNIALIRYLAGLGFKEKKAFRNRLLSLTGEDIRKTASDILRPGLEKASICVLSSREKLETANRELSEPLFIQDLW